MEQFEYVILGAGPAGLQIAYYLHRAGRRYLLLERGDRPGRFFETFPRHRKLISINKVHTGYDDPEINLRWDWNSLLSEEDGPLFKDFSRRYFPAADDMVGYLATFAETHGLRIEYGADIVRISRPDSDFRLVTRTGRELRAERLIVATGVSRENLPSIPGIELCETYGNHPVDPTEYEGKRVLIIGKGNSGFETAENLTEHAAVIHLVSPRSIRMAWRTHFVGDLRACNNNLLDTYQLKMQNAVLDGSVERIARSGDKLAATFKYAHADGEMETIEYDRVIVCAGFRFDASPFDGAARPELSPCGRFPAQTCEWESVNVPDLFFAGTLMQVRDLKKYMSGFIHGFRYNIRALSRILAARYHGVSWPAAARPVGAAGVFDWIVERINRSSALWQQPGFLCDAIVIRRAPMSSLIFEEYSVDLANKKFVEPGETVLLLTLEFGKGGAGDPFNAERVNRVDHERANASQFLHPILRYYQGGARMSEHHVIEDLAGEWREPEHTEPLRRYLRGLFAAEPAFEWGERVEHAVPLNETAI